MSPLSGQELVSSLARYDSCTIANAIESFDVQLRNEGFMDGTVRCCFPQLRPLVGYAVTLRVHGRRPPMEGGSYAERDDWWDQFAALDTPFVLVIEDADRQPGTGAFIGEVHGAILKALGCCGVITNGSVRDLPALQRAEFPLFASGIAVSHAYMHVVSVNVPVEVGGLQIGPGDLLHADQGGVVRIPLDIAAAVPAAADRLQAREQRIIDFCRSSAFDVTTLRRLLHSEAPEI